MPRSAFSPRFCAAEFKALFFDREIGHLAAAMGDPGTVALTIGLHRLWRRLWAADTTAQTSSPRLPQVDEAPIGSHWRHLRSGGDYMVIGSCIIESNRAPAILYRDKSGTVWARPVSEFLDGRFAPLDAQ